VLRGILARVADFLRLTIRDDGMNWRDHETHSY
jgi:hypothetical protein